MWPTPATIASRSSARTAGRLRNRVACSSRTASLSTLRTVGADGTLYVADTDNGCIVAVSPTGDVQATWGSERSAVGQLKYPEAVAIDNQGACCTSPIAATTASRRSPL